MKVVWRGLKVLFSGGLCGKACCWPLDGCPRAGRSPPRKSPPAARARRPLPQPAGPRSHLALAHPFVFARGVPAAGGSPVAGGKPGPASSAAEELPFFLPPGLLGTCPTRTPLPAHLFHVSTSVPGPSVAHRGSQHWEVRVGDRPLSFPSPCPRRSSCPNTA